ncbi:hypothetical protein K8352_16855 [Flavobacteriaceae bacterium F89]|uniref:Uncharacterized protein n=1 Tax=Cerina litoralis TaxID=2874477 RepID=A0AAE3JR02_9FLAO|nr:DUF6452 family protein [Cerina litoralis]MCG2462434.1 hypothetical protein [Cerina litoralis]
MLYFWKNDKSDSPNTLNARSKSLLLKSIAPAIILLAISFFGSCEKDDICVEDNTPLLVIRFYGSIATEVTKKVPSLRIVGLGKESTVNTIVDRSSLDSIALPLKINDNPTRFLFIQNSADDENGFEKGNIDTVTFNYKTKEVFISRACGYIANYEEVVGSITPDTSNWIQSISTVDSTVTNQATAHVKIFH